MAKKAVKKVLKKSATKVAQKSTKKSVKKLTKKPAAKTAAKAGASVASVGEAKSLLGKPAPSVSVVGTGGGPTSLLNFKGKKVVLYFYPKDNTPGCTREGYDFKRLARDFAAAETVILGVSKDSLKTHENFKQKCGFPFDLLVDDEEKLCRAFDVIQMKSLYGRQYLGIERSTFVIDEKGVVRHEWRKVKVNGHAEEVLDFVRKI
ncbi:hypothetical protein BH10BDE1_BH10BDE1_35610 [soil metagenome]